MTSTTETPNTTFTVYITLGNSDGKLKQAEWSRFVSSVRLLSAMFGTIHGVWTSEALSEYQNAVFCVEVGNGLTESMEERRISFKSLLKEMAAANNQDAITWAECPDVKFLGPGAHKYAKENQEHDDASND